MAVAAVQKRFEREPIDLSGAHLRGLDFVRTLLRDANLTGANLTKANLQYADLRRANLVDAKLTGANLSKADLRGAKLERADFSDADLSEARLDGCDFALVRLNNTKLDGCDLTKTKGITAWHQILSAHIGPNTLLPPALSANELLNVISSGFAHHFPWREKFAGRENELLPELIVIQTKGRFASLDAAIFNINYAALREAEKKSDDPAQDIESRP